MWKGRVACELTAESEVCNLERPRQDWEISASKDEENRSCKGDCCCTRVFPLELSVVVYVFKRFALRSVECRRKNDILQPHQSHMSPREFALLTCEILTIGGRV